MKRSGNKQQGLIGLIFLVWALVTINFGITASAATNEVSADDVTTVTIHKLGYDKDNYPTQEIDNTGDLLSEDALKGSIPIKNGTFTAYDLSNVYWDKYNTTEGNETAKSEAGKAAVLDPEVKTDEKGIAFPATDEAGAATLDLNNLSGKQNAVYLIKETNTPEGVNNQKSADFILGLPVYRESDDQDKNDEREKTVNVYPKNEFDTSTLEFTKYGIAADKNDYTEFSAPKVLPGANFILKEQGGNYLSSDNKFEARKEGAKQFTSDKNGKVSLTIPDIYLTSGKTYEFYEVKPEKGSDAAKGEYHYVADKPIVTVEAKREANQSKMTLTYTYTEADYKTPATVTAIPDEKGEGYTYVKVRGTKEDKAEVKAYNTQVPEPNKTVDDSDVDVAENLTYTISQLIPTDVTDYQSFVLSDTYDSQLQLLSDEKEILAGILIDGESAKDVDATYSADAAKANFKVMFTPSELVKYAGKTISFKVKMEVKPGSVLGKDITNTVDFENNFTPKEHKETVKTSGKQFVKTEWLSGNKLAGAEFVVQKVPKNPKSEVKTEWLQYVDDKQERVASITGYADTAKYNVKWVDKQDDATKLVSDDKGSFGVQGIELLGDSDDKTYELKETKAPTGHVILKNATSFTADDGKEVLEVANHSKGILPHTGGTGIIAFVVAGLAIISVSVIYFKKRRGEQLV